MGLSKSFRMNDRIENMFDSLKRFYNGKYSDSEILSQSVETMFGSISEKLNVEYRSKVKAVLNEEQIEFFYKMCDILETLSLSTGNFLEDEVKFFITYTQRFNDKFNILEHKEVIRMNNVFRYDKIESILIKSGYSGEYCYNFALFLEKFYEKK